MTKRIAMAVAMTMALAGCMTVGREIPQEDIGRLTPGKTTVREVVAQWGEPSSVTRNSDGTKLLIYVHSRTEVRGASFIPVVGLFAGGADSRMTTVTLKFDKADCFVESSDSAMNIHANNWPGSSTVTADPTDARK